MLWLSIYLPLFPLEIFEQGEKNTSKTIAIVEHKKILLCNKAAQHQGVECGLKKSSALALCNTLVLVERDIKKEKKMLASMAELAYQFSSQVVIYSNSKSQHSLLLEIKNSLSLFNGVDTLTRKIHQHLKHNRFTHQGFTHCFGIEKTPAAAELIARHYFHSNNKNLASNKKLHEVPVSLLDCDKSSIQHCEQLGLNNLGDIMQLPKPALNKRFNKIFISYLEKLHGSAPDLHTFFVPAGVFTRDMFFIHGLRSQASLRGPVEKMLGMLCTYLQKRQLQTHEIIWTFTRSSKNIQKIPVYFSAAQNNFDTLLKLSFMYIEKLPLDSPVESITLYSDRFTCLESDNHDLFEKTNQQTNIYSLIDTLKTRLGKHALWQVNMNRSHLPEKRNRLTPFKENKKKSVYTTHSRETLPQPAWLLKNPEKLTQSNKRLFKGKQALYIVCGPERIETGWWDTKTCRDYFIAKSVIEQSSSVEITTAFYWIYHDRINLSWYVHGIYS